MSRLQNAWQEAARELKLDVVIPFELKTEKFSVTAEILLRNFGSKEGMLIVTDYAAIDRHRDEIIKLGYGFVTMEEPEEDWPFTDEEREDFVEMLREWQWSGKAADEPDWMFEE